MFDNLKKFIQYKLNSIKDCRGVIELDLSDKIIKYWEGNNTYSNYIKVTFEEFEEWLKKTGVIK